MATDITAESLDTTKSANWRGVSSWAPALTEPIQEIGSVTPSPESAYVSILDYNLLIVRANERARGNLFTGALAGIVLVYIFKAIYKK